MRALVAAEHGGVEVLEVQDRPDPQPGPGELLVEVAASGVNFIDVYHREGIYDVATPFVLGLECAGRVVALGSDVSGFSVGDVVATAAAAMLQGMTAHYLVNSTYPVQPGDVALVHAAAGGAGQLLVQLVKAKGGRVIATVGSAEKVEIAAAAGADEVIRYDQVDDLAAAVREHAPDGVHVAYDGVGKSTFEASLGSLRRRGLLALFGAASGHVPPFDLQRLNPAGSLFVTRPTLGHYIATRAELTWRSGEVLGAIADGTLRISIGGRYSLDEAAQAYRDLEGRRTTGKLLLVP
jgi:NADPH2:quinone reductase